MAIVCVGDLAGLFQLGDADAVEGAAVELGDHRILSDVDQPAGQVGNLRRALGLLHPRHRSPVALPLVDLEQPVQHGLLQTAPTR